MSRLDQRRSACWMSARSRSGLPKYCRPPVTSLNVAGDSAGAVYCSCAYCMPIATAVRLAIRRNGIITRDSKQDVGLHERGQVQGVPAFKRIERVLVRVQLGDEGDDFGLIGGFYGNVHGRLRRSTMKTAVGKWRKMGGRKAVTALIAST